MAKPFSYTLQAESHGLKERRLTGADIHGTWEIFHKNPDDRGIWRVDPATGYLQITTNQNGLSGRYSKAMLTATDYSFETDIIPSAVDDDAFGIHFRYQDNFHFYFMQWDGGGEYNWKPNVVRIYKVEGDTYKLLGESQGPGPWVGGRQYEIGVTAIGTTFVVTIDGQEYLRVRDEDNPYLMGAYGPCATSQVCTWTRISSYELTPFILNTSGTSDVEVDNYDYATGKMIPPTVFEQIEPDLTAYLAANNYLPDSGVVDRYTVNSPDAFVAVYFNPNSPSQVTTDGSDYIYAYMKYDEQPPPAPINFRGEPGMTVITWSWTDTARFEDGFEILDENDNVLAVVSKDATSWDEVSLQQNTLYTRKLRAYNAYGYSAEVIASARTLSAGTISTPNPPINLRGVTNSTTEITWYWTGADGAESYNLYDEHGFLIATVTGLRYQEVNLQPDTMYQRYVAAVNIAGESGLSNKAVAFTNPIPVTGPVPDAPINMVGETLGTDTILWSWTPGSAAQVKFRVYDLNGEILYEAPEGVTEYQEFNLQPATSYSRYVVAFDEFGESPRSNYAYATTLAEEQPPVIIDPEPPWSPSDVVCVPAEREPIEKLSAFHSGIGDNLDLKVRVSRKGIAREFFTYDLQLKGYEYVEADVYAPVPFRFRFKAEGTESTPQGDIPWMNYSAWYEGEVNGAKPYSEANAYGKKDLTVPIEVAATSNVTISAWYVEMDDPSGRVGFVIQNGVNDMTTKPNDAVVFSSDYTAKENLKKTWYGPKTSGETVYVIQENELLEIKDKFLNPEQDPVLSTKNITEWHLIITSHNPNVEVYEPIKRRVWTSSSLFVDVILQARLLNPTQTAWSPLIHSGFYYFNQKEHYLHAESQVKGEILTTEGAQTVEFPYAIRAFCERIINPASGRFFDTNRADFKGTASLVDLDTQLGDMILMKVNGDYVDEGTYISDTKTINSPDVASLEEITWTASLPFGSEVIIETSSFDTSTGWTPWVVATNNDKIPSPVSTRLRYRATLKVGFEKKTMLFTHVDDLTADFNTGDYTNAKGSNDRVSMNDTELVTGSWISKVIDLGPNIDSMGTIKYKPIFNGFTGEAIEVLTVSSDSPSGPWDGSGEPILPLTNVVNNTDGTVTGQIASALKRYVRYEVRLTRGREDAVYTNSVSPYIHGDYVSPVLDMGHIVSFRTVTLQTQMPMREGSVKTYTISGNTPAEIAALEQDPANWIETGTGGTVQSPTARYIKVKVDTTPGKSALETRTHTVTNAVDFSGGTMNNIRIDSAGGYVELLDPHFPGSYESRPLDFRNIDSWVKIIAGLTTNGGNVEVSTSSGDTANGPWEPWSLQGANGLITSVPKNFIKFKLDITPAVSEGIKVQRDDTPDKFQNGATHSNVTFTGNRITNTNPELGMYYISNIKEITDYKDGLRMNYFSSLANKADLTVATQTSDDGVTWNNWVSLNPDGTIASPVLKYLRYRFDVTGGFGAKTQRIITDSSAATFLNPAPTMTNTKVGPTSLGIDGVLLDALLSGKNVQGGEFYSGIWDYGGVVTAFMPISVTASLPSEGGLLKVFTASSNSITNLSDPMTSNWSEATYDSATRKYQMTSPPGRYVRYRLSMQAGYGAATKVSQVQNTKADWDAGMMTNIVAKANNTLELVDPKTPGEFISTKMDFYTPYDKWNAYAQMLTSVTGVTQDGQVELQVRTAKSEADLDTATWVSIGTVVSGNLDVIPLPEISHDGTDALPYIQYKLIITGGRGIAQENLFEEKTGQFVIDTDDVNVALDTNGDIIIDDLTGTTAPTGTYISQTFPITDFRDWLKVYPTVLPGQGTVVIYTDVQGEDGTWEGWKELGANDTIQSRSTDVKALRFKFELTAWENGADWESPIVSGLRISYRSAPYVSPTVSRVEIASTVQSARSPEVTYFEIATTADGLEPYQPSIVGDVALEYNAYGYMSPRVEDVTVTARIYHIVEPVIRTVNVTADVYYWRSPAFDSGTLTANVFTLTRHTPVLQDVILNYKLPARTVEEEYAVSIVGKVPSDMNKHQISDFTMKQAIDQYMVNFNIDQNNLTRKRYSLTSGVTGIFVETKENNNSQYYADGESEVWAYTTSAASETVYSQAKVIVRDDNTAMIQPVPQQGAPIVVQDASGKELIEVAFLDENHNVTLKNTEEILTDGRREIQLSFTGIDPDTLEIWVDESRTNNYTKVDGYVLCNNIVYLPKIYKSNTPIRASYMLLNSYCVDYNYDIAEDYALIKLHNPVLDASREIRVRYETALDTAYYMASEINLNPMQNILNEGFIYLTDEVRPAKKLDVRFNPNTLLANGYDRTTILVIAKDEYDNPVVGDTITFEATDGNITVLQAVTDENGLATASYVASAFPGDVNLRIADTTSNIEVHKTIHLKEPLLKPRVTVDVDKKVLVADGVDVVRVTAYVVDATQQPAPELIVQFESAETQVLTPLAKTNYIGEAYSYIRASAIPADGLVTVKVTILNAGISEYINIGVV